jgi:hypothetical protein
LARAHARPQAPQWAVALAVSTSQPSATLALQSPRPAAQVMPHAPIAHVAAPPAALHALPQPPQLETLVVVFTSQPFMTARSQSA